jgi:hypothetical protein
MTIELAIVIEKNAIEIFDNSRQQMNRLFFDEATSILQLQIIIRILSNPIALILHVS